MTALQWGNMKRTRTLKLEVIQLSLILLFTPVLSLSLLCQNIFRKISEKPKRRNANSCFHTESILFWTTWRTVLVVCVNTRHNGGNKSRTLWFDTLTNSHMSSLLLYCCQWAKTTQSLSHLQKDIIMASCFWDCQIWRNDVSALKLPVSWFMTDIFHLFQWCFCIWQLVHVVHRQEVICSLI